MARRLRTRRSAQSELAAHGETRHILQSKPSGFKLYGALGLPLVRARRSEPAIRLPNAKHY
jgi:hypothetical protein